MDFSGLFKDSHGDCFGMVVIRSLRFYTAVFGKRFLIFRSSILPRSVMNLFILCVCLFRSENLKNRSSFQENTTLLFVIIIIIIIIISSFKCCFDTVICQVFYLRPHTDEGLLAFVYEKKINKNFNINISLINNVM